ncbi:MAG: TolB-like protein/DNA-binding winged helix-turn-helix (wHTH) protein [Psychroserpens sp.]|jgi:TolB-like protein/DNA-binding winged helix-turn-helix (wHTH) protein
MTSFSNSEFSFDAKSLQLIVDGEVRILDKRIATLLEYFLNNVDKAVSREELNEFVWKRKFVSADAINQSVAVLRKALGGPRNKYVITIPKVGYRFVLPNPILSQPSPKYSNASNTSLDVAITDHSLDQKNNTNSLYPFSNKFTSIALLLLIITIVGFLVRGTFFDTVPPPISIKPISYNIVVLPLKNLSEDKQLEYFSFGLTEKIQNNLSRSKGLVISAPVNSAVYIDGEIDNKLLAKETRAEFVLLGSVSKHNDILKVSTQLRELSTGKILFSNVFDKAQGNLFDIQNEISREVAAALNISVIEQQSLHSSMVERLDYQAVEQLYIARAQINRVHNSEIMNAIKILKRLNQQYPKTPEIMGLLVFAQYQVGSTSNTTNGFYEDSILLAEETLSIDPANFEALVVLSSLYTLDSDKIKSTKNIMDRLLRYYPGKKLVYDFMLYHFGYLQASCEELDGFVNSIPNGIYRPNQLSALKLLIEPCGNQASLVELNAEIEQELSKFSYRLNIPNDRQISVITSFAEKGKNNRFYAEANWLHSFAGAYRTAGVFKAKLKPAPNSIWEAYTSFIGYLNDQQSQVLPSEHLTLFKQTLDNRSMPKFSAALIKEAMKTQDSSLVRQYLAEVPTFKVGIDRLGDTIGLIALQHANGDVELSKSNAERLLYDLNFMRSNDFISYDFWKLAPDTFVSAIYANELDLAADILKNDFPENYPLWLFDKAVSETILAPWQDLPVVKQYLLQIEDDRERIRTLYNID